MRTSLTTYYDYRISKTEEELKRLNKERDATIERLKEATKYNSTQQLLEKYGSPKPKESDSPSSRKKSQGPQKQAPPQGPRTNIAPPPTANIQRAQGQRPVTPQGPTPAPSTPQGPSPIPTHGQVSPQDAPGEEFAPNAFAPPELTRQYSASAAATFTQPHWYDRILDALLGEDETQAKNRLALICGECRLVNGQAPPGTRTLEDVGRWRCGGCGSWNGKEKAKEDVVAGLVQNWEAERKAREQELNANTDGEVESDSKEIAQATGSDEGSGVDVAEESPEELPPARSTRSKSKGRGKK